MTKKIVKISGKDLDGYVAHLRSNETPKKSLNEFIQNGNEQVIADLSGFDFSKHPVDFRGIGANANFTGSILKNINFDGKYVVLKGSIMPDASLLAGSKFTNQIDLSGVNFGSIKLNREMFQNCQLNNAIYDPRAEKKAFIKLTETQINDYLAIPKPKPNINHFLGAIMGDQYPNLEIIVDFSDKTIDSRFNGADLANCKLENTIFTDKINSLNISNCKSNSITFKDCTLENCDLRNFSLTNNTENLKLENCKLSINKDLELAKKNNLVPKTLIANNCHFEPCYKKSTETNIPKRIAQKEIESYCKYIEKNRYSDIKSFNEFMGVGSNEYLDCSNLDLSKCDFSYAKFKNADFSYCKFNGSNFYHCQMMECNFSGADFASHRLHTKKSFFGKKPDLSEIKTNMQEADFTGSRFDSADLTQVIASSANFDHTTAINLKAEGLVLDNYAKANGAYWPGAFLRNIDANSLQAVGIDLSNSHCEAGNFQEAEISRANFAQAKCNKLNLEDARADSSNFLDTDFSQAQLTAKSMSNSRIAAKINGATIKTKMQDSDCSKLKTSDKDPNFKTFGNPLYAPEIDKFRLKQIDEEVKTNKLRINKQYAYYTIMVATALTLWVPLAISVFAPGLIPAVAISAIVSTAGVTISTLVTDFAMEKILGRSPGINKLITNIFGNEALEKISNESINLEKSRIKENEKHNIDKRQELEQNIETQIQQSTLKRITSLKTQTTEKKQQKKEWTKNLEKPSNSKTTQEEKRREKPNILTKYLKTV